MNSCIWRFILLLFASIFLSCENDLKDVQTMRNLEQGNPEIGTNVTLIYSDSGSIKAKLTAPHLKRNQEGNEGNVTTFKDGVNVFFYEDDSLQSTMKAEYAINYETKQITEVKNNVVIVSEKKERLETEQLFWDQKSKQVYTDQKFKLTTPKEIIYGTGLRSDQSFRNYKILKFNGVVGVDKSTGF